MGGVILNVDLGELPGEPEALYAWAHLANVACGGHAGDAATMDRAVALCLAHGTRLGAHPSYPDREGFGRRPVAMPPAELARSVAEQCRALLSVAASRKATIEFVKPHGALYHAAAGAPAVARATVEGIVEALGRGVTVVGPAAGRLVEAAVDAGLGYAREGFADRATRPDGTLVPRSEPGALLDDPAVAAQRARQLATGGAIDTVCVHGDTPGAVAIARAVRDVLDALGASP
jgi:UPF0271 protein